MACQYPQRRSWWSGRCKKPCKRHQAINSRTGRCVSQTYLRTLHIMGKDVEIGDEQPYHEEPLLIDDPHCYPRQLNLNTGRCRAPCKPHMAVNPLTGQCVTKAYLRSLDYDDYDIDEDCFMAGIEQFVPTTYESIQNVTEDNMPRQKKLVDLIESSVLTVADLQIIKGVSLAANKSGFTDKYLGVYDPKQRATCESSFFKQMLTSGTGQCGIKFPEKFSSVFPVTGSRLQPEFSILEKGKTSFKNGSFTWATGVKFPDDIELSFLKEPLVVDMKLLVVNARGVFRILVPKGETLITHGDIFADNPSTDIGYIVRMINKSSPFSNVSYHEFNELTSQ